MYRIILADDEGIVLDSLKMIIHRNFPDQLLESSSLYQLPQLLLCSCMMPDNNRCSWITA